MKLSHRFKSFSKFRIPAIMAFISLLGSSLSSCNFVKEDLEPCPEPKLYLRFVYDYNMERANAFPSQVDCLTVYFFNDEGKLVKTETVDDPALLSDEDYRMIPDLQPGTYHVVAYGGMTCENSSFKLSDPISEGSHYSDMKVQMDPLCLTAQEKLRLHNHFYGALDFTVDNLEDTHATVKMMRNTNSIQVALQNEFGSESIDHNDFIFEITDDNNDFDHENNLIPTGEITYKPWLKENRGTISSSREAGKPEGDKFHAAVAQFTTSRLMVADRQTKPVATRLTIRRAEDNSVVLSVPLVDYMLMFKHDNTGAGLDDMDDQEYLDRENTWNFVFFLKDGLWLSSHIVINDWEVRMNRPSL